MEGRYPYLYGYPKVKLTADIGTKSQSGRLLTSHTSQTLFFVEHGDKFARFSPYEWPEPRSTALQFAFEVPPQGARAEATATISINVWRHELYARRRLRSGPRNTVVCSTSSLVPSTR